MPKVSDTIIAAKQPARPETKCGDFELALIAASAGGIPALQDFLSKLPRDFPIPIAVVLHRAQTRAPIIVSVLSRKSRIPVKIAEEGEPLRSGTVYLAPARAHLVLRPNRTFHLMDGRKIKYVHSSANPLFESAAYALDGRVVAVVLTGSGTDGTNGVQTVKGMGGVVLVQDPASSAYSSMPLSAIGTGAVDHVLPLEGIPTELLRLVTKPRLARKRAMAASTGG
jgi:two-component system, chemotaxis family, protein-glutamate methylesterase/glutaminase